MAEIELMKDTLRLAKSIQDHANNVWRPPELGVQSQGEIVVLKSLVTGTRGYIEAVVNQVNGTYENGWYDACAVMLRRLIETLIIEAFEHHDIQVEIQNSSGDYLYLGDLVSRTLACTSWNLGRDTKRALPKLREIGNRSAHSRRFTARRGDIENILPDIRVVVDELVYLAGLK